jgi:outer membrane protein assembly factor BamB
MNTPAPSGHAIPPTRPLRLWPGVTLAALLLLTRYVVPAVFPATMPFPFLGGLVLSLAILIWWLFFSRARWLDRLIAIAVLALAIFAVSRAVHASIAGGMMGFLLPAYALPLATVALVTWAVATRHASATARHLSLVATMVVVCGAWTLVRTGGFSSDLQHDWAWRWSPTKEDQLIAKTTDPRKPAAATPTQTPAGDSVLWPGFRGANRDSIVRGARIATDWAKSPPVEVWRHEVGPGWSSFAVKGDRFYTQEQRGEEEIVACYTLARGEPQWRHRDAVRFWESNAGPGPRGTPTLHGDRMYTLGATGVLNAFNASTGERIWTRNAAHDTKRKIPEWGISSSPLIVGDIVVVAVSGTLAAYDLATGAPRWTGPADGGSYSSPHLLEIDGVPQIVLMSGQGATSVLPADGKVLWQHAWKGMAIVQPAQIANGALLISTGDRTGARRIEVAKKDNGWDVQERWTTNRLKAYFNDFILHRGHAYGFDGGMLTCIDVEDGSRKWKGGRYGAGQVLMLADQEMLLVLSEQGGLALVRAAPDAFTEVARSSALEGKTWNHPVLAGDLLLVRNDHEMAAFRLARSP